MKVLLYIVIILNVILFIGCDSDDQMNIKLLEINPNPFQSAAVIRFHLCESGFVTLDVYDDNNPKNKIDTLFSQHLTAGNYITVLGKTDNMGVNMGPFYEDSIFHIQLTAANQTMSRKFQQMEYEEFDINLYLTRNYPNPFNDVTTIKFMVYNQENITIEIFNNKKHLVRLLVNDFFTTPGAYLVTWNGTDNQGNLLPSGVYYYKFTAGQITYTREMIILRMSDYKGYKYFDLPL